jgi:hypothetical protein
MLWFEILQLQDTDSKSYLIIIIILKDNKLKLIPYPILIQVVSRCESPENDAFACGHVIVLVTSKVRLVKFIGIAGC